jgi:two-component system response regulator HydG
VRELENTIERAVALYDDTVLLPEYLGLEEPSPSTALRDAKNGRQDESEKEIILRALEQSKRHVSKAAQILGISRRTLYRKMGHFGIPGARKM